MALVNISDFMTIGLLNNSKTPVFRLQSISTGDIYALKRLRRHDFNSHLSDFKELTYITRCCQHPNIVKILGFSMNYYNNEYTLCLLMDLYKTDLQTHMDSLEKTKTKLTKKDFLLILKQLIEAFSFMQKEAKIAHRDIKPTNILLDENNNPIIIDFSEAFFFDLGNIHVEFGVHGTPE